MNRILAVAACVIVACLGACDAPTPPALDSADDVASSSGVCPPFLLMDERGAIIDPVNGVNDAVPYSPRQTCGATDCHDYDLITEGYHFTQGQGEEPTQAQRERVAWVSTPGNYGGSWCSPAPLYRYLSPKGNESAHTMDMTSYTFLTAGCGDCHPGGGSAEVDRDGHRYDARMADPVSGLVSGGENGLDGDYHKARWDASGVLEADCLLCHAPDYDVAARRAQIGRENFRWAATAGAGVAVVTGAVQDGDVPAVRYDPARFDDQGRLASRIVREPRNEACLSCHAKPGWKKRGANFSPRTDVHLRAGLKCVDCHPAGSGALDPRIQGREVHQLAKGDDPGGLVRDDLDDTVRACDDCHSSGALGAPIARHAWLPPLHLDELACQTCHIPERAVQAALVQAGDVFNPGARIPSKGKHLWTFYGPDGAYWNHYGDLEMMGYDDKPTDPYRPEYARYKGKIYPVNRIHSAWPGIEIEGQASLMQPKMGDVYKMWDAHHEDAGKYPRLAEIADDSGDDVPEINRPAEIEALIASVTEMLRDTAYPMEGKRVVWVSDDRVYSSGTEYRTIATEPWEASPFANVHKYSHDVYPARAALGAGGCTDCHAEGAGFFDRPVLERAFGEDGRPVWTSGARLLGLSEMQVRLGAFREARLKPGLYGLLALVLGLVGGLGVRSWTTRAMGWSVRRGRSAGALVVLGVVGMGVAALYSPGLAEYMTLSRFTLDSLHFPMAVVVLLLGALSSTAPLRSRAGVPLRWAGLVVIAGTASSGVLMLVKVDALEAVTRLAYTLFDGGLAVLLVVTAVQLAVRLFGEEGASERAT